MPDNEHTVNLNLEPRQEAAVGMASSEENANCVTADTIDAYAMTAPAMASNIRAEASAVGGVAEPANRTDTGAPASFPLAHADGEHRGMGANLRAASKRSR